MKALLISSNDKNSSNLALILDNADDSVFLNVLKSYDKDTKPDGLRNFILYEAKDKDLFTEFGLRPEFSQLIEENNIEAVFTYFESSKTISFALKENDKFINYDLLEFLQENTFEDLENLLKGGYANGREDSFIDRENQGSLYAGGGELLGGDRSIRGQDNADGRRNERGGAFAERGLFENAGGTGDSLQTAEQFGELPLGNEQRRGGGERIQGTRNSENLDNTISNIAQGEKENQYFQGGFDTSESRDYTKEKTIEFKRRIGNLLELFRERHSSRGFERLLRGFSNFVDRKLREHELSKTSRLSNTSNIQTQGGESKGLSGGSGGYFSLGLSENTEKTRTHTRSENRSNDERDIQENYQADTTSTNISRETRTSGKRTTDELSNISGNTDISSSETERREREEQTQRTLFSQELDTAFNGEHNETLSNDGASSERTRPQSRTSEDTQSHNGIPQNEPQGDTTATSINENNASKNDRETRNLREDLPTQDKFLREDTSIHKNDKQTDESGRVPTIREDRQGSNLRKQTSQTGLLSGVGFLNEFSLLKKLDGKEYKGEIDFKLSKNQRIEANFKALSLLKELLERKRRFENLENFNSNELLEFVKDQAANAGRQEEYYEEFIQRKRARFQQEIKTNNYFSFECPYNEKEQEILAKYTGFGGLSDLFYDEKFKELRKNLLNLVGEKLYNDLKLSSANAYYTPSEIIESMFKGLEHLGVPNNEKIYALEPSCGIGHFITKAPANYEFIAVEKESLSANIAKFLHPKTIIYNKAYEDVYFNREFDIVIGNPSYENERAKDSKMLIHNYFVSKSQALLKDGGLSSFVISSGFLDSLNNKHRIELTKDNYFVEAFRLPNSSFKGTHTEVSTDIVFLLKLNNKQESYKKNKDKYSAFEIKQEEFINSENKLVPKSFLKNKDEEAYYNINNYISYRIGRIAGEPKIVTNAFGEYVLSVDSFKNFSLKEWIDDRFYKDKVYDMRPAFVEIPLTLMNLKNVDINKRYYLYDLKIGNVFEHDNKFYTKEENFEIKEVFFEDEFDISKKYLLEDKEILEEKKSKLIYKNPLNEEEKEILRNIIKFRDLLNENLNLEKELPNDEESNTKILNQKAELRALRTKILKLSETKGFNQERMQSKKDKENGFILRHTLRKIIELEKLENFKIFASENIVKIPKKNKFDIKFEEADILQKRVLFPLEKTQAKDAKEALQKTINERGFIDLDTLESYLPEKNLEEILKELCEKELIFPDLEKERYVLKNEFFGGNIKAKAKNLEIMIENKEDFKVPTFLSKERYLELLKENFPKYINYEDLEINFGANYVSLDIYKEFIKQSFFNEPDDIDIEINVINGTYLLEDFTKGLDKQITQESDLNSIGIELELEKSKEIFKKDTSNNKNKKYFDLRSFLERMLNNQSLEACYYVKDEFTEKNKRIVDAEATRKAMLNSNIVKDAFKDFIFKNKEFRESIEKQYNEQINVFSNIKFEFEDFLETPYLNKDITLRTHQKNAVFKGIMQNSLLLDHQVGAGKTLAGIALVMEQIRMNLIKKALILVPNHLSSAWGAEFIRAYPNAKILIGDKINSKKARKEFLYRARNGDFDAIIMKHSTFENLNVLNTFEEEILSEELERIEKTLEGKYDEKELETKRVQKFIDKKTKKIEERIKELAKGKIYDEEIAFEDLGIDCLIVDEAHYFKNLFIATSQENVKGLPNTNSRKAMKMYCATQYCHQNNFKLYFLTGTPISNSIAEFYTMQRYLQPHILRQLNLGNFDDWQRAFTNITLSEELDSSGVNYTLVSRLSEFINAPELMNFYKQNADIVSTEDIEKLSGKLVPKVKSGKAINIIAPRSEAVANFIGVEDKFGRYNKGSIIDRMNNFTENPKRNNILVCTSEAKKAALDFRLIDPFANDYEDSKINKMISLVKEHYDDTRYPKNTQLIFCDLGVSKKHSQKINVNAKEDSSSQEEKIEEIAKRKGLELVIEKNEDEDGNEEEKSYYVEYEKDDEGKFVYEEVFKDGKITKQKIIAKAYEIEELLNEQVNFDVYSEILKKLVLKGIPQNEIAFIGDAKSDSDKQKLFDKVNAGLIRVLIGSTAKMGTGTNVQERVVAMHELDCPWKPSELEQRAGRGIRQGNVFFENDKENFEIAHYRYATEQTYDSRMFQINEQKLKPLVQMKKSEVSENTRVFEAIDAQMENIAEMKAIATGNPFILEKHKIENLKKAEIGLKKYYEKSILSNENILNSEKIREKRLEKELDALSELFNNKEFLKENYDLEILGIKTTRRAKNKNDEKNFKQTKEKLDKKIYEMLTQTDKFTIKTNENYEKSKIEFLKANGFKIDLFVKTLNDGYYTLSGRIITENNKSFTPSNLFYHINRESIINTEFNIGSFLVRVENFFKRISTYINDKTKKLKECRENIASKQRFLEKNTLDTYERGFLINILIEDEINIGEIFRIRQEKRKEGIRIDLESEEIKHLLPKYTKYLDEKGKLINKEVVDKKEEDKQENKENPKEQKEEKEQKETSKKEVEKIETKNLEIKKELPINPKENKESENKENENKEIKFSKKSPEDKIEKPKRDLRDRTISKNKLEQTPQGVKIKLKEFEKESDITEKMEILMQNNKEIRANRMRAKRILDR